MSNSVSIDGYVHVTKDFSDVIREAVVGLLLQKYPDGLSTEEINNFVQQCYLARETVNAALAERPTPVVRQH